jgi:hypothetical protein
MITNIEEKAAARRANTGSQVLCPSAIRSQHLHGGPAYSKRPLARLSSMP